MPDQNNLSGDIQGQVIDEGSIDSGLSEIAEEGVSSSGAAEDFLNLEALIKTYAQKIDKIEKELREKSQMLKDAFESDAVYKEHADKAKEANRIKSATKQQILKQPAMQELDETIKDMKFDIAEQQAVLNDYLTQYQQQTGANQIELADGEIMDIVTIVRLTKRSSRR